MVKATFIAPFVKLFILDTFLTFGHQAFLAESCFHFHDLHMVNPTFIAPFVKVSIFDIFWRFGHQGLFGADAFAPDICPAPRSQNHNVCNSGNRLVAKSSFLQFWKTFCKFSILAGIRPHRNSDIEKNWYRLCPLQVSEKPKILNQTIALCYGFQKTDVKFGGAILGWNPLGLFIGFRENTKNIRQEFPFQICDVRKINSGYPISGFWVEFDPTEISTLRKIDHDYARFRFSKNQKYWAKR